MLRRTPDALRAEKTTKLVPKKPGTRVRVRTTDELPPAAATPNEEVIPYKDAVTELREIVARANDNQAKAESEQMRSGEIADKVESIYGDRTISKLAKEGGIAACTLKRRRTVYRAWQAIGAAPPQFAVAQELHAHPDREQIIKRLPNITSREARKLMTEYRAAEKNKEPSAQKNDKRWFRDVVQIAGNATQQAEITTQRLSRERRQQLRAVSEPKLIGAIREGGEALIKIADWVEQEAD